MHIAVATVAVPLLGVAMTLTACRLDPRVSDTPGASAHILPMGTEIPDVNTSAELLDQIRANDSVDDVRNVVPLQIGRSNGAEVRYWSFGPANSAPAPLFELIDKDGVTPLDHPPLVYALPGDPGYNPLHSIFRVIVTGEYEGQLLTSAEALADAVEIGLVEEPKTTRTFVNMPIVLEGTQIEIGPGPTTAVASKTVYARGFAVSYFRFGGAFGEQPLLGVLPTRQVSFVRGQGEASYNVNRPVFQATIPPMPVGTLPGTYSALSTVVEVDLANGTSDSITSDVQLFGRGSMGEITSTEPQVATFEVTTTNLVLQLQFPDNNP